MTGSTPGSGMKGGKRRGKKGTETNRMDTEESTAGEENGLDGDDETEGTGAEDDFPEIEMDELLEHFDELDMADDLDGGEEV